MNRAVEETEELLAELALDALTWRSPEQVEGTLLVLRGIHAVAKMPNCMWRPTNVKKKPRLPLAGLGGGNMDPCTCVTRARNTKPYACVTGGEMPNRVHMLPVPLPAPLPALKAPNHTNVSTAQKAPNMSYRR